MTEDEWRGCKNPRTMLDFLNGRVSGRKLRLFAFACCRSVWHHISDRRSRAALVAMEDEVDQPDSQLLRNYAACLRAAKSVSSEASASCADDISLTMSNRHGAWAVILAAEDVTVLPAETDLAKAILKAGTVVEEEEGRWGSPPFSGLDGEELVNQCHLLRDIIGNPIEPVTFLPEWRTTTVIAIARQMYDTRDFSAMPILSDALQDAGCSDFAVLSHCRREKPHIRGCHLIDACLSRS